MGDRHMRGAAGVLVMLGTGITFFGCDGKTLTAPTPHTYLTVRVVRRVSEVPIVGAFVRVAGSGSFYTDGAGLGVVDVGRGEELHVDVSADGFVGFGADGAITDAETWTFYLERANGAQP